MMADVFVQQGRLDEAEKLLQESLSIGRQINHLDGIAFDTVKLGQIAGARGDAETALARYRAVLAFVPDLSLPTIVG